MGTALIESLFKHYHRIARSERGSYRLCRLVRRLRPATQWRDRFTTPNGFKLDLNLGVYPDVCMAYGLYELSTVRLLKRLLKSGDHVVDAGANIGYITLHAARYVGKTGKVDAFEPQPENFNRLKQHLLINDLQDRVTTLPYALSDHQGSVPIYHWPEDDLEHNHGCASLFTDHSESAQCEPVECRTLDELLDGQIPRLIKMDIEGAEPMMVEGMFQTLIAPTPPIIIGELNPTQARVAGFAPHEWIARILDIQPAYKVYTIGSRIRKRHPNALSGLGQMNLMLKV
ncbi:MAG TPA: hypothetical protein DCM28_20180 [Phycisphaerales bacterium]|nr:hypothetical protein [Phycisphaerales bacterium]HCD33112.1 hypothetical protein [Phycisphaerales bacterium]